MTERRPGAAGGRDAASGARLRALDLTWRGSFFSEFAPESQTAMRAAGRICLREPGQTFPDGHVALVLSGMVGGEAQYEDRTLTLVSVGAGGICGIADLLGSLVFERRAITVAHAFLIPEAIFTHHARSSVQNALATARAVSYMQEEMVVTIADHVMLPMRSRVARYLIDFARREGVREDPIAIRVSPSRIAREIGTVPAVVVRTLAELERDELIERHGASTVILRDPEALAKVERGPR